MRRDDGVLPNPDTTAMPATTVPPALRADKALMRQIAEFDDQLETCVAFLEVLKAPAGQNAVRKDLAALRKRMKAALEANDRAAVGKAVAALAKDAAKAADAASAAIVGEISERCKAQWAKARGLLAQALVEVGALEPAALRLPLQKEQVALRGQLDRIEQESNKGPGTITELEELTDQCLALLKRIGAAAPAGQWLRTAYAPLVNRTRAAIQRVPAERCRRTLLAELDFIDVDVHKALQKADAKTAQARSIAPLQRIEKLAVQVVAAAPALDRELARLARRVAGASGATAPLVKRLKALAQARATTWPAGPDADGIAAALTAFEADLARLAAEVDRSATAATVRA
jgi:hypothetical protein